jgi:tryptophan synthase alpha chain
MSPNRIESKFSQLKARGEKALIAYIMAGDPSLHDTETLVLELERAGADIIELGVPFSDPIADGPVIQKAAERALRSGTSLRRILEMVASLRLRTQIPLVFMAYYNTIHAFGEDVFCRQAAAAGVDGLIVPDMPPEEDTLLAAAACDGGPLLIYLLAPTSTPARFSSIAGKSKGFIYYVSLTGITGSKLSDMASIKRSVTRIRRATDVPVAVGFGIATPHDVSQIIGLADGVIVGTAIVRQIEQHRDDPQMPARVAQFVKSLKAATHRSVYLPVSPAPA